MHEPTRFKKPAPNRKPLSPYLRSYEQSPPPPLPPPPLTSFTLCRALHGWPCRISAAGYPKGKHQLLPPVAPRAALPLHFWDILATVKDDSVAVATMAAFPTTCLVSRSPAVFWWAVWGDYANNCSSSRPPPRPTPGAVFLLGGCCCLVMTSATDEVFVTFWCVRHAQVPDSTLPASSSHYKE